jgi:hypothetical protein
MQIQNGGPRQSLNELVLFPFDDHSLPFQDGVQLQLIGHSTPCGRTRIVLGLGPEGAPDSKLVVYYGSVHRVGDELWMWYLGQGTDDTWFERLCLAKSKDGIHWERPNLGLVEYNGNRANNLIDLNNGEHHVQACVVFYEPDDTERPFKLVFESDKYNKQFAAAYSADGLTWHEYPNNPVGRWFEMAGGTKFDGCYYLTGQGGHHPGGLRQLVTYVSYDFENWSSASCVGLRRSNLPPRPVLSGGSVGEQVHLGAALWNRGNVLVGFYGMWHGHPSNDRRLLTMDLGLAITNDALHYREPIPDFPIVAAAEDGFELIPRGHTAVHFPALIQGQGFENVGDETLFWYAPWPEQDSDGVRVARWGRDRLGYFQSARGRRTTAGYTSHVVSAPIELEGRHVRLFINAETTEYSQLRVSLLDKQFNPLPDYSGDATVAVSQSGFKLPVTWQGGDVVRGIDQPIRVRLDFEGIRAEDARIYALYLTAEE